MAKATSSEKTKESADEGSAGRASSSSGGKSSREEASADPATPAASTPPVATFYDPMCAEQGYHRANCDCTGDARKPFAI